MSNRKEVECRVKWHIQSEWFTPLPFIEEMAICPKSLVLSVVALDVLANQINLHIFELFVNSNATNFASIVYVNDSVI